MPGEKKENRIRIAIVDDHPIVRSGLAAILSRHPNLQIVGEAEDVRGGIELADAHQPDVMIVDLGLRSGSGLDLVRDVKARHPAIGILVVSMYDDSLFAERAIRAGARGYVNKQEAGKSVVTAIHAIVEGKVYLSPEISSRVVQQLTVGHHSASEDPIESLSDRELGVFMLIGKGQTTVQIAETLDISVKTVETYRQRIKEKLMLQSATELVRTAICWVMEHPQKPAEATSK